MYIDFGKKDNDIASHESALNPHNLSASDVGAAPATHNHEGMTGGDNIFYLSFGSENELRENFLSTLGTGGTIGFEGFGSNGSSQHKNDYGLNGSRMLQLNNNGSTGDYYTLRLANNLINSQNFNKIILKYSFILVSQGDDVRYRFGLSDQGSGDGSVTSLQVVCKDSGQWFLVAKVNSVKTTIALNFNTANDELSQLTLQYDSNNQIVTIDLNGQTHSVNLYFYGDCSMFVSVQRAFSTPSVLRIYLNEIYIKIDDGNEQSVSKIVTPELIGAASEQALTDHLGDFSNPHQITPSQIGAAEEGHTHAGTGDSDAIANHESAADPHPNYLTGVEADTRYDQAGTANSAITNHESAADPHPIYLTKTEADTSYDPAGTANTAIANHESNLAIHLNGTLSVSKGGTGGTFPENARYNLGLGTRDDLARIVFGEDLGEPNDDFASQSQLNFPPKTYPSVTWNTGWESAYTSGDRIFKFYVQQRTVYLNGFVERVSGNETVILTLPTGSRPLTTKTFPVVNNASGLCVVRVTPSGDIQVISGSVTSYLCLDGIIFGVGA